MKNAFCLTLVLSLGAISHATSVDYLKTCTNTCKAANGTEFCISQINASRTDVAVYYSAPNGDNIITNIYPYAELNRVKAMAIENSKLYGQIYQTAVKNLVDGITCLNNSQNLLLSEPPEMQQAF